MTKEKEQKITENLKASFPDFVDRTISNTLEKARKGGCMYDQEASLVLHLCRQLSLYSLPFEVLEYSVFERKSFENGAGKETSFPEATILVREPNGLIKRTASTGCGLVDALNKALRKALVGFFPSLRDVKLVDYNVDLVSKSGTTSVTRVVIKSEDNKNGQWETVGISPDVIRASFIAIVESLQYKLFLDQHSSSSKSKE